MKKLGLGGAAAGGVPRAADGEGPDWWTSLHSGIVHGCYITPPRPFGPWITKKTMGNKKIKN